MKNFINKVQDLGKKAASLKQAIQSAPGHAAQLKEAVVMSADELHQIRSVVQANLHGLRANSEDRLLAAMREINDASLVFEEAGYELAGLDLDLSLPQRLAVHLEKFDDLPHSDLRTLFSRQTNETIKAIIGGLLKAEETAANVELSYLNLTGVIVHVGAVPLIRMCWRTEEAAAQQSPVAAPVLQAPVPPPIPVTTMPASAPSIGSFFEPRAIPTTTVTPVAPPTPTPSVPSSPTPVASPEPTAPAPSPWSRSALDRFKKMPDLSKHKH